MANGFTLNEDLFFTFEGDGYNFTKREINRVLDMIEERLSK